MSVIDSNAEKFLGNGMIFPIVLNNSGRPDIVGGKELLEASFKHIMSWAFGTRYMLGEFGTKLEQLLQEPNDLVLQTLVKHYTVDVISKWEKRVEVLEVKLESKEDTILNIKITYKVISTKQEESFIFPYYSQLKF